MATAINLRLLGFNIANSFYININYNSKSRALYIQNDHVIEKLV